MLLKFRNELCLRWGRILLSSIIFFVVAVIMLFPVGSTFQPVCTPSMGCSNVERYHSLGTMLLLRPAFGEEAARLNVFTVILGGAVAACGGTIPLISGRTRRDSRDPGEMLTSSAEVPKVRHVGWPGGGGPPHGPPHPLRTLFSFVQAPVVGGGMLKCLPTFATSSSQYT